MSTEQVTIRLASDVTYVEGYVNGTLSDFALQENNIWLATVDRADNNIYTVDITAYHTNGLSTNVSITLYYGVNLIFDRTNQDLYYLTDKAYYNATDLNRVESSTEYISILLKKHGYLSRDITCKKDWVISDIPLTSDMTRYLANIRTLMDAFYLKANSPSLPLTMDNLDINKANDIEKILNDLNELIENMEVQLCYSGEIFAGEGYYQ